MVAEPTRQHTLHTVPTSLFTLFPWHMGLVTPPDCQVVLNPTCHCWCRPRVGGADIKHCAWHFPHCKKGKVFCWQIHITHSIFLAQTFLVLCSSLSPFSCCNPSLLC
jgi:hypothetical protein